jgi:alpha-amylase/alpha-mannosidase (GH57 family)
MVKLALLWHMHQPYYEDLATGEHILPWVRLHALKDYWGMVALHREFPGVRLTFNLVPSLLVQVEAFAADHAQDRHLVIGVKPADALEPHERAFLVANGFHAQFDRMIRPFPRYLELHDKRGRRDAFDLSDLRDLQVLHKLVWMDPDWRAQDSRLLRLVEKGRAYSEDDKAALREVELELLNAVIPAYREAAGTGRVELSTSPFYHPILPLLVDSDLHFRAHPTSPLPRGLFSRPEDALLQLTRALEYHEALFGSRPRGVWPSEGSVSDDVLRLLGRVGCEWTATDEDILARSLQRALTADDIYRPYMAGSGETHPRVLFRDHRLSDLIGFTYQSWETGAAVADFIKNVREAGRRFPASGKAPVVCVILDGENAWEHYPGGGRPFLRALYAALESASDIETITMSEAAAMPARELPSVFPGSWINGDFYVWAGHRDDHRAWAQLAAARMAYENATATEAVTHDARAHALEELLIAEGSDWFWWYGDDHSSEHDRDFDELFRRHLRNVYRALGVRAPEDLHLSNISTASPVTGPVTLLALSAPEHHPAGDFAAWALATEVPLGDTGGTMHRIARPLTESLRVLADRQTLYLRLDGAGLASRAANGSAAFSVMIDRPRRLRLPVARGEGNVRVRLDPRGVIISAPFAALGAQAGDRVSLFIVISDADGHFIEQQPGHDPLELDVPDRQYDAIHWLV